MLPQIEIKDMYNQVCHKPVFGLDSYIMPKQYADPAAEMRERELQAELKKGGIKARDKNRKDKNYMDFIMDRARKIPASCTYNTATTIGVPAPKDIKAINFKDKNNLPSRMTYVDRIFKYNKIPAPGKYNTAFSQFNEPTKEQKEKAALQNKRYQEREHFLCDTEFIHYNQPGVGAYNLKDMLNPNTRQSVKEIDRKLFKDIESKHDALVKSHQPNPSSCSYNPIQLYPTFEKKLQNMSKKDNEKQKYNRDMSQQVRFAHYDPKRAKSLNIKPDPGPGAYTLQMDWPAKATKENKNNKTKNISNSITKGISKSIYY